MYTYCIYLNWYEARFTTKNNPPNILVAPRETSQAAGRWTLALQILDDAKASGTVPSGKQTKNYGKIHHFSWENQLFLWPCSIAMLNYQRVFSKNRGTSKNIQADLRTHCIDFFGYFGQQLHWWSPKYSTRCGNDIGVCKSSRQWHEIKKWPPGRIWVSQKMASAENEAAHIQLNDIVCNAAISACEKGGCVTFGSHWSQDWFAEGLKSITFIHVFNF